MTKTAHGHFASIAVALIVGIVLVHVKPTPQAAVALQPRPAAQRTTDSNAGIPPPPIDPVVTPAASTTTVPAAAKTASKPTTAASSQASTLAPVSPATTPTPPVTPTSDIATEAQCPGQASLANVNTVLVCMSSFARQAHGLGVIKSNNSLVAAATAKTVDIQACSFSHTACGRAFNYWFAVKGYKGNCQAENIAQGQQTPGDVFTAWMNSAGHRANILNASYNDMGVAELASSNGPIWVMELGGCPA